MVQSTINDLEKDPMEQRSILRLELAPLITVDVNKGKGLVFDYDSAASSDPKEMKPGPKDRILSDAIKAGDAMTWKPKPIHTASAEVDQLSATSSFSIGSTVQRAGIFCASSSGTKEKGVKLRRRPNKSRRKPREWSLMISVFISVSERLRNYRRALNRWKRVNSTNSKERINLTASAGGGILCLKTLFP
ncbi:unnamed protein product [Arabis nemorensis]|uniref:Uncharacterized protein n=1 Tax=Arabis nemorensis TaxID=586526 RepID=A0A565BNA9_9BRAS|nr:unnamed protein product [Arabis nemorensis]